MKRKIIIGLAAYSLLLLLGGLYVVRVIHGATTKLDELIIPDFNLGTRDKKVPILDRFIQEVAPVAR